MPSCDGTLLYSSVSDPSAALLQLLEVCLTLAISVLWRRASYHYVLGFSVVECALQPLSDGVWGVHMQPALPGSICRALSSISRPELRSTHSLPHSDSRAARGAAAQHRPSPQLPLTTAVRRWFSHSQRTATGRRLAFFLFLHLSGSRAGSIGDRR